MSIVLQGSTSGSITLQEPAVAGSNTISLPAATGTAVLTGVSGNVDINAASSNNVTLSTNSTERMRITSGGDVGIKTSSPATTLDIYTNTAAGFHYPLFFSANNNNSAKRDYLQLGFSIQQGAAGSETGGFDLKALRNNTPVYLANYEGAPGTGTWRFYTEGTERMRITSGGDLRIGTTGAIWSTEKASIQAGSTGGYALTLSTETAGGFAPLLLRNNDANSTKVQIYFAHSGTVPGSVTTTASATQFNTSSDYRLKENVAPMTGALAKVSQLKPVTYTWKVDGSAGEGFIAHELAEVVPQCVTGEKDAVDADGNPKYQGVDTSFLVATLTAAIQELKGIVDTQATKIAELEAKLEGTA